MLIDSKHCIFRMDHHGSEEGSEDGEVPRMD